MRGMGRLIEGLQNGDPTARNVLIFAVLGTVCILIIVSIIRKRRGI